MRTRQFLFTIQGIAADKINIVTSNIVVETNEQLDNDYLEKVKAAWVMQHLKFTIHPDNCTILFVKELE